MFGEIVRHELKNILFNPKFFTVFVICSVLILMSISLGIYRYKDYKAQYETAVKLVQAEQSEAKNWNNVPNRVYVEPNPLQIFVAGVAYDIGRYSPISQFQSVRLSQSYYSVDPAYALFRTPDFIFIVTVVLSLFAFLFTYDSVNGEYERGTMQLVFANALPRKTYLFGKIAGTWLGLTAAVSVPVLLGLLIVFISGIYFTGEQLGALALMGLAGLLYFTLFIVLGVYISVLVKRSSISFLASIVVWILLVFIMPVAGTAIANKLIEVPTAAEIEAKRAAFEKNAWDNHGVYLENKYKERWAGWEGKSAEERQAYEDANLWQWIEEDDAARLQLTEDITRFTNKLQEESGNKRKEMEALGYTLSRFSPASAFQLAVLHLAGTDPGLKDRYETAMMKYKDVFTRYTAQKQKENPGGGGFRISMDTDRGFSLDTGRDKGAIETAGLPVFAKPQMNISAVAGSAAVDSGIIAGCILLLLGLAVYSFGKYEIR